MTSRLLKSQVSFAKEPCKRDNILQKKPVMSIEDNCNVNKRDAPDKRPLISRSPLIVATQYFVGNILFAIFCLWICVHEILLSGCAVTPKGAPLGYFFWSCCVFFVIFFCFPVWRTLSLQLSSEEPVFLACHFFFAKSRLVKSGSVCVCVCQRV